MKTVYYIRHAKSSWADYGIPDSERPLNKRGLRDAPFMAAKLKALVDENSKLLILSSTAQRTKDTLAFFKAEFAMADEQVILDSNLYLAPPSSLMEALFQVPDEFDTVFLFAHNPGITELANALRTSFVDNIPTCGIFKVDFNVQSWIDVDNVSSSSNMFIYPKMYLNEL